MDANKLQKLNDIDYTMLPCCGICQFADLSHDGWGTCTKHTYKHKKHTGAERQLSITRYGSCASFLCTLDQYELYRPVKIIYDAENK
jgi:hypothetical protein